MQGWLCLALFGCTIAIDKAAALSCKSDTDADVDFAYAFKYPAGWEYAYMDSHHKLAKSEHTLDSSSSSVSKTLEQMKSSGASYVLWNDQPPPSKSSSAPRAHSKGVIIFGSTGGIWLTHSLPDFPSTGSQLWEDGSDKFGQAFLCITLTAEEIHKLSPVMSINEVVVYAHKFATGDEEKFADLKAWAVDGDFDKKDMTIEVSIKSKGGQTFELFGKSGHWGEGKDLYKDLVAPKVGDLYMEGWRRGRGPWGPACGSHKVLDVTAVSFPGKDWDVMNDHSKWASGMTKKVFCVGDINRMDGQDKRGGGTVCISDSSIAAQMKAVINTTDKCHGDFIQV